MARERARITAQSTSGTLVGNALQTGMPPSWSTFGIAVVVCQSVSVVANVLMLLVILKEHLRHQLPSPAYCLAGFAFADLCRLVALLCTSTQAGLGSMYWLYYFGAWSSTAWLGAYVMSLYEKLVRSTSTWSTEAVLVQKPAADALPRTRWLPWSDARRSRMLMRWTICWLLPIVVVGVTILVRTVEHRYSASSVHVYSGEYCFFNGTADTVAFFTCSVEVLLTDMWFWLIATMMLACFVVIQLNLVAESRRVKASLDGAQAARLQWKLRLWPHFALYLAAFFICPFPLAVATAASNNLEETTFFMVVILSELHGTVNLIVYGGTQVWFSRGLDCQRARAAHRRGKQSLWHVMVHGVSADGDDECRLAIEGPRDSSMPSAMESSRRPSRWKPTSSLMPIAVSVVAALLSLRRASAVSKPSAMAPSNNSPV